MSITDKINFRQAKYMLPAILYLLLLFFGYFFFRFFNIEKAEVGYKKQTTTYYNNKMSDANLKGDGIGDMYSNMVNNFGKIKDESAVENIERGNEEEKEACHSQYTDAEMVAMDQQRKEAQRSMERLRQLQEQIKEQQKRDNHTGGSHYAKLKDQPKEGRKTINEKTVSEIAEKAEAEEVVKRQKETSEFFNTIATNEPQHKLIRTIVDEETTAVDGSRVRLRLLDDIDMGER